MKRIYFLIILVCLAFFGCVGNSSPTPKIELNVETVNFCNRPVGESVVWNNLQLRNPGKGVLTVSGIRIRGDADCTFSCSYPDPNDKNAIVSCPNEDSSSKQSVVKIDPGQTLLVRIEYSPSAIGETAGAALIIESDAANLAVDQEKTVQLAVPMCGLGVSTINGEPDGGVSEDRGLFDGGSNLEDCPSCDNVPKKGASACSERD